MKIVSAKCPNCGGILEVDSEKDAAICQFCQTPFIVEKAIENYNITNNYTTVNNTVNKTVNNISGQEVHVHQDGESPEQLLENIKALLNRKEYDLAQKTYEKLKEKYPADYRVDEAEVIMFFEGYYKENPYSRYGKHSNGIADISPYKIPELFDLMGRLREKNSVAYETQYNILREKVNAEWNKNCGTDFKGGMVYFKLTALRELSRRHSVEGWLCDCIGGPSFSNKFYPSNSYEEDDGRRGPLKMALRKTSNDDSDDEFIIYVLSAIPKVISLSRTWQPSGYDKSELNSKYPNWQMVQRQRENDLSNIGNLLYQHLSPEGKKEQRRSAIKDFWNHYARLLRSNSIKDAYNLLSLNTAMKGVNEELAKFKKGFFGVKYLSDISSFNVNEIIAESFKAEGL